MQTVVTRSAEPAAVPPVTALGGTAASAYQGYQIIRRNGAVVAFEPTTKWRARTCSTASAARKNVRAR